METIKLRELELDDTFLLSALIDKMGVAERITELIDEAKKTNESQDYFGKKIFALLINQWHLAKDEVREFAGAVTNRTAEEAGKLKITQLKQIFIELLKDEQFKDFFSMAVEESK